MAVAAAVLDYRAGDVPEAQQSIEEVGDEENAFLKFLRVSFVRYYLWLLFDAVLVAGGLAAADAAARRLLRAGQPPPARFNPRPRHARPGSAARSAPSCPP